MLVETLVVVEVDVEVVVVEDDVEDLVVETVVIVDANVVDVDVKVEV